MLIRFIYISEVKRMNEEEKRFDKIEYDENWQTVSSQTYAQPYCEQSEEEQLQNDEITQGDIRVKKEKSPKQLVIILQLILCILIFSAFYQHRFALV